MASKKTILVIEDEHAIRDAISYTLQTAGYRVTVQGFQRHLDIGDRGAVRIDHCARHADLGKDKVERQQTDGADHPFHSATG